MENVTWRGQPVNSSLYSYEVEIDDPVTISGTLKFTPKEDGVTIHNFSNGIAQGIEISPKVDLNFHGSELTKGTEYTLTFNHANDMNIAFKNMKDSSYGLTTADLFVFYVV